jgi:hypothetical protein
MYIYEAIEEAIEDAIKDMCDVFFHVYAFVLTRSTLMEVGGYIYIYIYTYI